MVSKGSKYTDSDRNEAAIQYAVLGNMKAVAKATGIPRTTIVGWKKTDWWQDAITSAQIAKADEHRARYSELVDKAQQVALEKLPEANARDALIIAATSTDKIRLFDGMPTAITGKSEGMEALARRFQELSEQVERDRNVVSVQEQGDSGS